MPDKGGVRVYSGSATRTCQKVVENLIASGPSGLAGPGDDRTLLSPFPTVLALIAKWPAKNKCRTVADAKEWGKQRTR